MQKIKGQSINIFLIIVFIIVSFLCIDKYVLPNDYNDQNGTHIWLSSSTIKFTNYWLKDGALNLKFIMYELPSSIELDSLNAREPYISYPPGCIMPSYIIAKILGKSEIGISFVKHMLEAKYLLDSILIGLIIYSVLTYCLKLKSTKMNILISIIISMFWMILPNNLYYLRNVYFSDQLIITVVLLYILLEIFRKFFENTESKSLKTIYFIFEFLIILYGVIVDYYFLFVVFVAFLIKILPLLFTSEKKGKFKLIIKESAIYVLPVIIGISMFIAQVINVQNFKNILIDKAKIRMGATLASVDINSQIIKNFTNAYTAIGLVLMIFTILTVVVLTVYSILKYFKKEEDKVLSNFTKLALIVYIPPIMQIAVLRNHSAIHEFSMLKFGLPLVFSGVVLTYAIFKIFHIKLNSVLKLNIEDIDEKYKKAINLPVFCFIILFFVTSVVFVTNSRQRIEEYYKFRCNGDITYELENLIKQNSKYEDVYFSYTYEISANPPMKLSVSDKLVYKIEEYSDINKKFPNMNKDAQIFFVVEKNDFDKDENILKKEMNIKNNSELIYESKNYYIYKIEGGF